MISAGRKNVATVVVMNVEREQTSHHGSNSHFHRHMHLVQGRLLACAQSCSWRWVIWGERPSLQIVGIAVDYG